MKILEDPHQDPERSLHRSLKIVKDLKKIFTRVHSNLMGIFPFILSLKLVEQEPIKLFNCNFHRNIFFRENNNITF